MTTRGEHSERAQLLRRVLALLPGHDEPPDRAIRRRVEGAIIAEELNARGGKGDGWPGPGWPEG